MKTVEVVVLVENTVYKPKLRAEHGLSLYIDAGGYRILFDTGASALFMGNAKQLGIRLHDLDALILSHNHYDHTGGVEFLIDLYSEVPPIYGHPKAFQQSYREAKPEDGGPKASSPSRAIGFPYPRGIKNLRKRGLSLTVNREAVEVAEGIWLSGEVPRHCSFESVGDRFFTDPELTLPDSVPDDQALIMKTEKGLLVFEGCCHSGIVNTLEAVSLLFPEEPVRAVVGGLHLRDAGPQRIRDSIDYLKKKKPEKVIAGHCTGEQAMCSFRKAFGKRFQALSVGRRFTL